LGATAAEIVDSSILEVIMITNHKGDVSNGPQSPSATSATITSRSSYSFVVRDRKTGRVGLIDPCLHAVEAVHSAIEARDWESPSALFLTRPDPYTVSATTTATNSGTMTPSLVDDLRKIFPSIQNNVFGGGAGTEFDTSFAAAGNVLEGNTASYYNFAFGATIGRAIPIQGTETSGPERRRGLQEEQQLQQQQRFAFHFPSANVAFVGNEFTLLGYREGGKEARTTADWYALRNLRDALPPSTVVYTTQESAGHDAQFAVWADGGNFNTQMAVIQVARGRAQYPQPSPTVPFVMSDARIANPFLRMDIPVQKEREFKRGSSLSAIRVVTGIDMEATNSVAFEELLQKREAFFGYTGHTNPMRFSTL